MKHLKTFENFVNEDLYNYAVGDLIYIDYEGQQRLAKVMKINSKNSYIINLEFNEIFNPEPIEIRSSQINGIAKGVEDPAMNNDMVTRSITQVSNDMVINGYPKTI